MLWLSHDPIIDRLFRRRDGVLSAAVADATRVAEHDERRRLIASTPRCTHALVAAYNEGAANSVRLAC